MKFLYNVKFQLAMMFSKVTLISLNQALICLNIDICIKCVKTQKDIKK